MSHAPIQTHLYMMQMVQAEVQKVLARVYRHKITIGPWDVITFPDRHTAERYMEDYKELLKLMIVKYETELNISTIK